MKKLFKLTLLLLLFSLSFAKEPNKKVSMQLMWLDQFEFAGFYIAIEKGYYNDVGLDVELLKYTKDTNLVESVVSKKADFGTGSSSLIIDKSKGNDIVLLGSIFQSSPLMLMGLKDDSLSTLEDIKNKKIMLATDQQRFATLQAMLASRNIKIKDIEILEHSFDVNDLINRKTDLMLAYTTNEPFILNEKGYQSQIFHPKDYGFDFYENIIFTTGEFADNHPKLVSKFYDASIKGWYYAFNNIEEVAKLVFEKYNPQHKSLASLIFEATEMKKLVYTINREIGTITKEKVKLIEQSYRILGLLDNDLNIDDLIYTKHLYKDLTLNKEELSYLDKKRHITMCIDPQWLPFEKIQDGKHIGMTADYFKLLEKILNISITMVPTKDWSESIEFGKQRKCDIFSLVMKTPNRKKYLNFTKPYMQMPLVIASDLNTTFVDTLKQLKNKRLGVVKDYAISELLRNKYPKINFIDVKNVTEGLQQVQEGKLYGFIDTLATIAYTIQQNHIGQLKISGRLQETWDLGVGTRNDEPLLNSIFDKAMELIPAGKRQEILNKWVSVTFEKGLDYNLVFKIVVPLIVLLVLIILLYRQYLLRDLNTQLHQKVTKEIEKNNEHQKMLFQQAKMAAMGEMIGNIAHQWRQPLSTISIAATGMKFQKDMGILGDKEIDEAVESIKKSTQFLSDTIDDFKNFFKSNQAEKVFNINTLLEKSFDLYSIEFSSHQITLVKDIHSIEIKTYENELIQVIINILNNAKDAFEEKEKKYIFVEAKIDKKDLLISIKDNAGGIEEEILPRIFEPYFTTKHKSQGTGIGLYMSQQIISQHMNGDIKIKNSEFKHLGQTYRGAEFTIQIPLEK